MFDVDYGFLAIAVLALAVSALTARRFRAGWAGVLFGILAGMVVVVVLVPFWAYLAIGFEGMFIGLEDIPD
ncbi:MAG: hypothetical protein HKN63_00305 [Rhodobacteraceae bacterium]|nr:hypothetical protein [Alphaproteobacteria bacterium]MBT8474140.1 hypothetical protein [Alphaproteobacteria bacterium]NNF23235.1 hypothetical protein [Paracoccaceae bacterium]NNK65415.1 hypothetical protein [Paracoccaceae bacterium]NNL34975.1 hypothetical protein [Silicimonas sp.]